MSEQKAGANNLLQKISTDVFLEPAEGIKIYWHKNKIIFERLDNGETIQASCFYSRDTLSSTVLLGDYLYWSSGTPFSECDSAILFTVIEKLGKDLGQEFAFIRPGRFAKD